jgi:hypothetical protein
MHQGPQPASPLGGHADIADMSVKSGRSGPTHDCIKVEATHDGAGALQRNSSRWMSPLGVKRRVCRPGRAPRMARRSRRPPSQPRRRQRQARADRHTHPPRCRPRNPLPTNECVTTMNGPPSTTAKFREAFVRCSLPFDRTRRNGPDSKRSEGTSRTASSRPNARAGSANSKDYKRVGRHRQTRPDDRHLRPRPTAPRPHNRTDQQV